MANPVLSHLVSGTIRDIYGNKLAGATVSLKHTLQDQTLPSVTSVSDGTYVINLSELDSQWSIGEEIKVTASKSAEGTKTETTVISSGGGQTVNITLAETSDLTYYPNDRNIYTLNFSLLVHYDGEKVTRERPLPVSSSEIDLLYNPAHSWTITRSDGQPNSETVVIQGDTYTRTFTYNPSGQMIARSKWEKQ